MKSNPDKTNNIPRRQFLKTAGAAAASLTVGLPALEPAETKAPLGRPNILWITMEDTCPQFLGCYGNKSAHTPNMDWLAARGVRFNKAFSTGPVCAPSRCTIITGVAAEKMGTGNHRSTYPIPDFIKGFPYYLRHVGYFTSNNLKTDYNLGGEKHFVNEAWNECFGGGGWGTSFGGNADTFEESSSEAGWWHRKPGQPFFSVFNFANSHQSRTMTNPYDWYVEEVLNKLPESERIKPDDIVVPPFYRDTPEMRHHLCRVYNSLQLTDREFGRILDRLEQDGLAEDTIVFCFADHGEGIPRGKTSALGLGFQVPFFIYFPPKYQHLSPWPAGEATDELVSSSEDAAPTVLSLAGVDIPKHMTGRPLAGAKRRAPRPFVWANRNRIDGSPDLSRAVADGRYFYTRVFMPRLPEVKYIKYMDVGDITRIIRKDYNAGRLNELQASLVKPVQPTEYLFDLDDDPWQTRNLAGDAVHREHLEKMRVALQAHLKEIRDIHFMPEYEIVKRSKTATAYEFRQDDQGYPFARILATANLSGGGEAVLAQQMKALKDSDATVRYWAAVGLDAQGEAVKPHAQEILAALSDPHPSVQSVAAGIAFGRFQSKRAREMLESQLESANACIVLQACQAIQYLRDKAKPFAPALRELLARRAKLKPLFDSAEAMLDSSAEDTLHFLEGAPLYYGRFVRWTPKAQLERDPTVHFEH